MDPLLSQALKRLQHGGIVVVYDHARENRVHLVSGASLITPETICDMVNHGRGIIFAALSTERAKDLGLPSMVEARIQKGLDLTVSVEARQGVTTGISAADRAATLKTLAHSKDAKVDIVTPGHIFPIRAKIGGVLVRSDIAEAAVDLLTLANLPTVAAVCQCLDEQGELLRNDSIERLSKELNTAAISISDIIQHRLASEQIVEQVAEARLPTSVAGEFRACCFRARTDQAEHLALVQGDIDRMDTDGKQLPVLVRVQAEHRLGDLLGFHGPSTLARLHASMKAIQKEGRGVLVYVRHPRKGMLSEQLSELESGETSSDVRALREHGIGAQILRALGVKRIKLLSGSPRSISGIDAFQIEIVRRVNFDEC